ncbi:MAG: RHS repeat domain-containing protein, partial [Planctomycetota bacterium]
HAGTGTTLPTSGTAALYYHRNQQYSIVGLSDAAGTLVERYAYTAYGELTILAPDRTLRPTSSFENRYTYTAREWDPTLRLYYFRARWLEPKAGRFIGRDPLGYVDGMGLYGAYFGLEKSDPSGSWAFPCSCDCVHEGGLCSHKEGHVEANDYLTALSKCDAKCRRYSSSPGETCTPFYCSGSLRGTGGENGGVLCAYLVHLCDQYQDPEERKECKEEAKNICMCIAKAYDKMMEAGGPVRFRKNQNDTEAWVCEKCSNNITTQCELDGISQKYFFLFHRSAAFGIRRPWDYLTQFWMGYGHQWNNITFTGPNGKYEYITIDMWSNPTDWWNPGLDSCGSVDNMSGDLPNLPHLHRKRKN